jgi:alcohol dehydrogenase
MGKYCSELARNGLIKPIIDKVYPLKDAGQGLDYLESGRAKGKVIIKIK